MTDMLVELKYSVVMYFKVIVGWQDLQVQDLTCIKQLCTNSSTFERLPEHCFAQCLACWSEQFPVGQCGLPVSALGSDIEPAMYFLYNRKIDLLLSWGWSLAGEVCRFTNSCTNKWNFIANCRNPGKIYDFVLTIIFTPRQTLSDLLHCGIRKLNLAQWQNVALDRVAWILVIPHLLFQRLS